MKKEELREKQKQILTEFATNTKKKEEDQRIFKNLSQVDLIHQAQTIGITASLPIEIDTSKIIAHLWDLGKDVYLAKVVPGPEHKMNFVHYTYRSPLKKSAFGVEEVSDPDAEINNELNLILVPGLAFAEDSKQRLGFGGGYYDRFIASHPEVRTIALANSKMLFKTATWPIEDHDLPVEKIITAD